jgi:hypothetical protein
MFSEVGDMNCGPSSDRSHLTTSEKKPGVRLAKPGIIPQEIFEPKILCEKKTRQDFLSGFCKLMRIVYGVKRLTAEYAVVPAAFVALTRQ